MVLDRPERPERQRLWRAINTTNMNANERMRQPRWRIYLFNTQTGERQRALAKHADMLTQREARYWVRQSKIRMTPPWEYRCEKVTP